MTNNLLDRTGGNTKLGKTNKSAGGVYRVAGLSLMPSDTLCPARLLAECAKACLESAGRGRMQNVIDGRQRKADWFASDPESFLAQLTARAVQFHKDMRPPGREACSAPKRALRCALGAPRDPARIPRAVHV